MPSHSHCIFGSISALPTAHLEQVYSPGTLFEFLDENFPMVHGPCLMHACTDVYTHVYTHGMQVLALQLGQVHSFLSAAIEPPPSDAIAQAMTCLRELGAVDARAETLTPLGHHLARIPVDVHVAKMILFGAMFR